MRGEGIGGMNEEGQGGVEERERDGGQGRGGGGGRVEGEREEKHVLCLVVYVGCSLSS